jgi:hypothetical protein
MRHQVPKTIRSKKKKQIRTVVPTTDIVDIVMRTGHFISFDEHTVIIDPISTTMIFIYTPDTHILNKHCLLYKFF